MAVLHDPDVLNIPFLSSYRAKAKLTYLSSIVTSRVLLIEEMADLISSATSMKDIGIPKPAKDALRPAIQSMEKVNKKTFPKVVKRVFDRIRRTSWDQRLSKLTVQNKFTDTSMPEKDSGLWRRFCRDFHLVSCPFYLGLPLTLYQLP